MASAEAGGRKARAEEKRRLNETYRAFAIRRTEVWLQEFALVPGETHQPLTEASYRTAIDAVLKNIVDARWPRSAMFQASRMLQKASLDAITRHDLKADPFFAFVEHRRSSSFRSEKWFHSLHTIDVWQAQFEDKLNFSRRPPTKDREFWLGLLVWSAMSRGFCSEEWLLEALVQKVFHDPKPLERGLFDRPVVSLEVEMNRGDCNIEREGKFYRRVVWPPDALSLALIAAAVASKPSKDHVDRALELLLASLSISKSEADRHGFSRLGKLAKAAVWLAENRPGVRAPQTLVSVAVGEQSSQSLDHAGLVTVRGKRVALSPKDISIPDDIRSLEGDAEPLMVLFFEKLEPIVRAFDDGRRKVSRETVRLQLDAVEELFPPTSMERLLIEWFKGLLDRKLAVSTVVTYKALVARALLDEVSGRDITKFNEADFSDLYGVILDQESRASNREQRAGRLQDFHDYLFERKFIKPRLGERLLEGATSVRRVRARHIPHQAYLQIRRRLRNELGSGTFADHLELGVILAWRAGLRVGEVTKLRLCDIENSPERTLFIRDTPFGNNKSPAAKRQITLSALLTSDELIVLERVLASRRTTSDAQRQPLLHLPGSRLPLDKSKFSELVSKLIRRTLNGDDWTFHHLRHSAFNNLFLILEGLGGVDPSIHGWSDDEMTRVRASVVGDAVSKQKVYFALAAFAGHASPTETFGSYIHLTREALSEHVARMNVTAEHHLYAPALGKSQKSIAALHTDGELRAVAERKLTSRFAPVIEWDPEDVIDEKTVPPFHEMVWRAFKIISHIEEGATIKSASRQGDPPEVVARWVEKARAIAGRKSRKHSERHISRGRKLRHAHDRRRVEILLPARPNRGSDEKDVDQLVTAYEAFKSENENLAEDALEYCLKHLVQSKAGIRFTSTEKLEAVLQVFESATDLKKRWYLEMCLADPTKSPSWRALFPEDTLHVEKTYRSQASVRPSWAKGHVFLHLENAGWKNKKKTKEREPRSSRALRFAIHMLGIVEGSAIEPKRKPSGRQAQAPDSQMALDERGDWKSPE